MAFTILSDPVQNNRSLKLTYKELACIFLAYLLYQKLFIFNTPLNPQVLCWFLPSAWSITSSLYSCLTWRPTAPWWRCCPASWSTSSTKVKTGFLYCTHVLYTCTLYILYEGVIQPLICSLVALIICPLLAGCIAAAAITRKGILFVIGQKISLDVNTVL